MNRRQTLLIPIVMGAMLLVGEQASAFRSTSSQSFTDPDYQGFQVKKVALAVEEASNDTRAVIEKRMVDRLGAKGITATPIRTLLPPTREWTPEEQVAVLERNEIDSILVVTVGASSESVRQFMTQSNSRTNTTGTVYGSGGFNANSTTNTTSTPVYAAKSAADFSAVLVDVAKGRTIWYADVTVKASGTLFVGGSGDAKGAASEIVDALTKDGHLPPK